VEPKDLISIAVGPTLDLAQIHPASRGAIEHVLHHAKLAITPELYVGIVDTGKFGATALAYSTTTAVAVNFGLLVLIFDLFYSFAESFDEDMDVKLPLINAGQITSCMDRSLNMPGHTLADREWPSYVGYKGLSRFQLSVAAALVTLAVQYVIYHERAHIVLGHLGYIRSLKGGDVRLQSLQEERSTRSDAEGIPFTEMRALELLADHEAIRAAFVSLAAIRKTQRPGRDDSVQLLANPDYVYRLFLLAVSAMMFTFWLAEGGLKRVEKTHPHPDLRHTAMLGSLLEAIAIILREDGATEVELARHSFARIEPSIHALRLSLAGDSGLYEFLKHNLEETSKSVEDRNTLREAMQKKTRPYAMISKQ
jgi:hypothetical protein